jgi:hypothetical protein
MLARGRKCLTSDGYKGLGMQFLLIVVQRAFATGVLDTSSKYVDGLVYTVGKIYHRYHRPGVPVVEFTASVVDTSGKFATRTH